MITTIPYTDGVADLTGSAKGRLFLGVFLLVAAGYDVDSWFVPACLPGKFTEK
jgi:hypothetical protein